jgi:integrase
VRRPRAFFAPYSLRHTFASMESDSGIETTSLARLMGHTTTRTLERYVSNTFEHRVKAFEAMQDRIRRVLAADRIDAKCAT